MDGTDEGRASGSRRRTIRTVAAVVVAAGLVFGLVVAGITAATAQAEGRDGRRLDAFRGEMKKHLRRGPGIMGGKHRFGPGIHGEFTVRNPDGGYRTVATQLGEVTSVSSSSIEVESEDGFSRTYAVNDETRVLAGDKGIADVAKGDQVRVVGFVEDGKARAVRVIDVSKIKDLRGKREQRSGADGTRGT